MDDGPSAETTSSSGELAASCPAFLLRILTIFSCCSGDNKSVTVPHVAGNLTAETKEFIVGLRLYSNNMLGKEFQEDSSNGFHLLFLLWNTFLQPVQDVRDTSASISSDIHDDINKFITLLKELSGEQWTEDNKNWIKVWLQRWNFSLQARAGNNSTAGDITITSLGDYYFPYKCYMDKVTRFLH